MGKILLIDDDLSVLNSTALVLEETGHTIFTASSGKDGLKIFTENGAGFILLDLKMSGMNGVETLREIRKLDMKVPIYVFTAFHKEFLLELKEAANEGLQFEILNKPVEVDRLIEIVNNVLE